MKKLQIILIVLGLSSCLFSQEITEEEITSDVTEVTVFLEGAQITRKTQVELNAGESLLKFVMLSPFIDAKSIQVKVNGELMVLSVNHQQNFLNKSKKSAQLSKLENQLEELCDKKEIELTRRSIIQEEITFLKENRNLGGKNEQTSLINLKETSAFYAERIATLMMDNIQTNKAISNITKQIENTYNQIKTISTKKEYPTGEILVKIDAEVSKSYEFELSYFVGNVSWFPSYDLRAKNLNAPIQLKYKANIKQNTRVDWKNVKLKLSSADPNVSGVAPRLQTNYLNYYRQAPGYVVSSNEVRGKVVDQKGESLPGVSIVVEGTTIGTISDLNGNYSITVPDNSSRVTYSSVGYLTQTRPISNEVMNITLQEDITALEDIVVVGYGASKKREITGAVSSIDQTKNFSDLTNTLQGQVAGISTVEGNVRSGQNANIQIRGIGSVQTNSTPVRGAGSLMVPVAQNRNQTSIDFEIETPYTINSDNKNYVVDMEQYDLSASYQYFCVPKINRNAFLMANINNWQNYNLLEGEANIFFEDTFIGKTLLDTRHASDTLQVSLGPDKQISVSRNKEENYSTNQLLGHRKEETLSWKIEVRNNKAEEIDMILLDQVPVSASEDIEVDVHNTSNAKHHPLTGEIKWKFKLAPSDEKEMNLKYSVKYSKYMNLVLD